MYCHRNPKTKQTTLHFIEYMNEIGVVKCLCGKIFMKMRY
jgi:hypothetical protein